MFSKIKSFLKDKKKINFIIYGIGQSFNLVTPLLITPFIILKCGSVGLGKVGLGFSLALFLILIVDYSFEIKGVKQIANNSKNHLKISEIYSNGIVSKLVLFFVTLLISYFLINNIEILKNEKHLLYLSLFLVFAQVFNPTWILQGIQDFKAISIINISSKILYVLLFFVIINKYSDYIYINFCLALSNIFIYIIGMFYLTFKHSIKLIPINKSKIINILKLDFSFCISQLILSIRQLSPLFIISFFLGFNYGGVYKIVEQFITLFRTFIQVYQRFFFSEICIQYFNNPLLGIKYWSIIVKYIFIIVLSLIIIILLFSDNILLYFNVSNAILPKLNIYLYYSLLVSLLMSVSLPLEQLVLISGKNNFYIKTTFIVTIINLILLILLLKYYNIKGVLFSIIISELLFIIIYYICIYKIKKNAFNT